MGDTKLRCQSCSMPLEDPGLYGTKADGMPTKEFCKFCFENGKFKSPEVTMEQMIDSTAAYMTKGLAMPEDKALEVSRIIIPTLKRWRKTS